MGQVLGVESLSCRWEQMSARVSAQELDLSWEKTWARQSAEQMVVPTLPLDVKKQMDLKMAGCSASPKQRASSTLMANHLVLGKVL